jgi:pyruvate dehydrogenase E1 component
VPYISQVIGNTQGPIIASSDYMKAIPDGLAPWIGTRLTSLGTDGFGRSENREHLRHFFEISAEAIVQATLAALARSGAINVHRAEAAIAELGFSQEKPDPSRQ